MTFNFPTLNHGCVCGKAVNSTCEEDRECEEGYAIGEDKNEEVGHSPDWRAEICGQISVVPKNQDALEEMVGQN